LLENPKAYSDQSVKLERINMDNQQGNLHIMDKYFEVMGYSIGAMMGDGSVKMYTFRSQENSPMVTTTNTNIRCMDSECVQRVCSEINNLFQKDYKVTSYLNPNSTKIYQCAISDKVIYDFFHYFIREKLHIPDEAFRVSRSSKIDFIAGLFDTDGYVTSHSGYYRVGFASRHRTFVEDTVRLLSKLGVKVGKIHTQVSQYDTTMYIIKPNIRSFIEAGCYFFILRKADKLAKYEGSVNRPLCVRTFRDYNVGPKTLG